MVSLACNARDVSKNEPAHGIIKRIQVKIFCGLVSRNYLFVLNSEKGAEEEEEEIEDEGREERHREKTQRPDAPFEMTV